MTDPTPEQMKAGAAAVRWWFYRGIVPNKRDSKTLGEEIALDVWKAMTKIWAAAPEVPEGVIERLALAIKREQTLGTGRADQWLIPADDVSLNIRCGEIARAILAELTGGQEMSEWQPIETAPKDGSTVLVATSGKVTAAWWDEDQSIWTELLVWNSVFDEYEAQPIGFAPTHWMPLPPPPQDTEGDEE